MDKMMLARQYQAVSRYPHSQSVSDDGIYFLHSCLLLRHVQAEKL